MAGRPKKPESDRRTNTLRIRLTEEERKAIDSYAEKKALDSSTFVRMAMLELIEKDQHGSSPRKGKKGS